MCEQMTDDAYHNIDLLKEKCWNLEIEEWHSCPLQGECSNCGSCYAMITVRHAKFGKNGDKHASGNRYCAFDVAENPTDQPFSSEEIAHMRSFFGMIKYAIGVQHGKKY